MKRIATITASLLLVWAAASFAAQAKPATQVQPGQAQPAQPPAGLTPPADYVIGAGDVLIITFWKEPDMSNDNTAVRPDGKITLPLINDVDAAGLKPEQLRDRLAEMSKNYLEDPRVSVTVRAINSRKVYILGPVGKPGPYDLLVPMRVQQLISLAGGLREFTSGKKITIIRELGGGKTQTFFFNYQEVLAGKKLEQNIELKPGDTVQIPE